MYSNKENVNILTALLVAHGVKHAVVCPGSRNAAIVHNLNECPSIECHPVTDERSAGFYALGMTQATGERVVVCVTSGTALLNLAPAVAEAFYQHRPLIVISADRPEAWIDQLDGQTLPQGDALGRFVKKAVSLPEPIAPSADSSSDAKERYITDCWHCNRLVNETLIIRNAPVHINIPITEPLFSFTVAELPHERKIDFQPADISQTMLSHVTHMFMQSRRPMLISGQPMNALMDEAVIMAGDDERYVPEFVVYTGGAIVSKRLKRFLRRAKETWAINAEGEVNDTFMNLTNVIQGDGEVVADYLRFMLEQQPHPFVTLWNELLQRAAQRLQAYEPPFSQMAVVKMLETSISTATDATGSLSYYVHYANSSAIRLANIYACHAVFCNRGVNGIEGSLSTAAGFSLVADKPVVCVIGDLSFFYDQNALWNKQLDGRLRILLLNNRRGGIFNMLPGLEKSPARDSFVAAAHDTTAEGICQQNDIYYQRADDMETTAEGLRLLLSAQFSRPMVLEVTTDASADEQTYKAWLNPNNLIT